MVVLDLGGVAPFSIVSRDGRQYLAIALDGSGADTAHRVHGDPSILVCTVRKCRLDSATKDGALGSGIAASGWWDTRCLVTGRH